MKIDKLKSGMTVYDVHSHKMGNTTMRTMGCWSIRIIEVFPDANTVKASWNSNPAQIYREKAWSKWRLNKPVMINTGMRQRLATREELKAMKANKPKEDAP